MALTLYQPEKYRVHLGRGRAIGFCSVWNEAETIFKNSKVLQTKTAIVGTLYSRQGVNVILRNLALNPQIRELYLWSYGPLSQTQFGLAGRTILEQIWQKGVAADGSVRGFATPGNFKLEPEIVPAVVNLIRAKVKLINIGKLSLAAAEKKIVAAKPASQTYMKARAFPEHQQKTAAVFPSETVGWLTRGEKILPTWNRVVERIMRYGLIKGTQYGYQQRELIGVTWVINNENPEKPDLTLATDWPKILLQTTGAQAKSLKEYYQVFLSPEAPAGLSYTYGNRLMRYPDGKNKIDQITEVIEKQLRVSPDARRTVATTMVPAIDKDSKEPPCLTQIQALQTNGTLHLLATFRSHDIFKAGIANAFGLRQLQLKIARDLDFQLGQLQITSQSAHIYEQDWADAARLVHCQFWEREPATLFDPHQQGDPRGNIIVSLENRKIVATLQSPQGAELLKLEATDAKTLGKKIAQLELLSRTDHIFDIAQELQKAELALQKKVTYRQDRPLSL